MVISDSGDAPAASPYRARCGVPFPAGAARLRGDGQLDASIVPSTSVGTQVCARSWVMVRSILHWYRLQVAFFSTIKFTTNRSSLQQNYPLLRAAH
jgi:hypothetical protein